MMQLWGEPAIWKFPIGEAITIRGNFTKSPFNNGSINCDNLSIPAEWVKWPEPTSAITTSQSGIKECLDTGLRAADYMIDKKRPELAEAAFSFAANARLQGAKPE